MPSNRLHCTRFRKERLKQAQQTIRWFLQRSGKANVSHSEYLSPHSTCTTHELGRPKALMGRRGTRDPITHALPPSRGGKWRPPVLPRKTSRPPGGAAATAPAPGSAPRPLGRAGPRPPRRRHSQHAARRAPAPAAAAAAGRRRWRREARRIWRPSARTSRRCSKPPSARATPGEGGAGGLGRTGAGGAPAPGAAWLPEGPTSFPSPPPHPLPGAA